MSMDPRTQPAAEAKVARAAIWPDVVKRGEMRRRVRGLGVLGSNLTADIKIAETPDEGTPNRPDRRSRSTGGIGPRPACRTSIRL